MSNASLHLKRPRHILNLSAEEKRKFLDSFDAVYSDIDGVVWLLGTYVDQAPEGYKALEEAGKKITFVTNNSVRSESDYSKEFKKINMDVDISELVHPAKSIVKYLRSINFEGLIYIIATENFKNVLREAGFKLIDGPTKIISESFREMASNIFDREQVDAVIIDVDLNLSSMKLMRAHFYLRKPECLLIAGAVDMLLPVNAGLNILGPGSFSKVLAESSGRNMIILGKPGQQLAEMMLKDVADPKRVLMIGDTLEQDVAFGRVCGFQTLLVLSGGCSRQELDAQTNEKLTPDYYADSVADFVEFMKDLSKPKV